MYRECIKYICLCYSGGCVRKRWWASHRSIRSTPCRRRRGRKHPNRSPGLKTNCCTSTTRTVSMTGKWDFWEEGVGNAVYRKHRSFLLVRMCFPGVVLTENPVIHPDFKSINEKLWRPSIIALRAWKRTLRLKTRTPLLNSAWVEWVWAQISRSKISFITWWKSVRLHGQR